MKYTGNLSPSPEFCRQMGCDGHTHEYYSQGSLENLKCLYCDKDPMKVTGACWDHTHHGCHAVWPCQCDCHTGHPLPKEDIYISLFTNKKVRVDDREQA